MSGFRANSSRSGTTPALDWMNYPSVFGSIIERLRGVVIEQRLATEIMLQHDSQQTLHYVDPPYVHSTRSTKVRHTSTGKSYKYEMTDDDHVELSSFLKSLNGYVMVSGYNCDLYNELYSGWLRIDKSARADGARLRVESLWFNPRCKEKQLQLRW